MAEPFLAEIRLMSFNYPPKGWAFCNGQFLPINQNQALFSLLGTTYGGNGQTTFALPNLQGRVPIHMGDGHQLGEAAGQESVTLTVAQLPAHTHVASAASEIGDKITPGGNLLASVDVTAFTSSVYAPAGSFVGTNSANVTLTGGSQAHENRQPFLTISFCIALVGIFPSQN